MTDPDFKKRDFFCLLFLRVLFIYSVYFQRTVNGSTWEGDGRGMGGVGGGGGGRKENLGGD